MVRVIYVYHAYATEIGPDINFLMKMSALKHPGFQVVHVDVYRSGYSAEKAIMKNEYDAIVVRAGANWRGQFFCESINQRRTRVGKKKKIPFIILPECESCLDTLTRFIHGLAAGKDKKDKEKEKDKPC